MGRKWLFFASSIFLIGVYLNLAENPLGIWDAVLVPKAEAPVELPTTVAPETIVKPQKEPASTKITEETFEAVEIGAEETPDKLSEPEVQPTPNPVVIASPPPREKITSKMYRMKKTCQAKAQPSHQAKNYATVDKGKKVWVDGHDADWGIVYFKSGKAFIPKTCL